MRPIDPRQHTALSVAAPHLGRASHVLEDFFAHSNFLELAKRFAQSKTPIPPGALLTGSFEDNDKLHALGHKIVSATDAILGEFPLLLRAFGRVAHCWTLTNKRWTPHDSQSSAPSP
jgi:hypothetical protein